MRIWPLARLSSSWPGRPPHTRGHLFCAAAVLQRHASADGGCRRSVRSTPLAHLFGSIQPTMTKVCTAFFWVLFTQNKLDSNVNVNISIRVFALHAIACYNGAVEKLSGSP